MISVSFVGRLGQDAQLRTVGERGSQVLELSVAVNQRRGQEDLTTWFRVSLWGRSAVGLQPHALKGREVFVAGKLYSREWTKDGVTRTSLEVDAQDVRLVGSRPDEGRRPPVHTERNGGDWQAPQQPVQLTEDDLPF